MQAESRSIHGMWSSRLMFILAATGSAVGLGNIWRFPYMASENGGGAFVLIYLACIAVLGLPLLMAEVLIGREGRGSAVHSIAQIANASNASRQWRWFGVAGVLAALVILSFYSVIAGWTLHYAWLYVKDLAGMGGIEDAPATFGALLDNPVQLGFWHGVFIVLTVGVVALGVEQGLERAVRWLMPALFAMLLLLVAYGFTTGYAGQAAAFLFAPDFSKVTGQTYLAAMGQAFFTLSLGSCAMLTYGAYLPRQGVSLPQTAGVIALADTSVALLAGMAIFPIVLAYGIAPEGGGPGLIFAVLPKAFAAMPFGALFGLVFFALLAVAAWTSSISMLEPATAWLVERFGIAKRKTVAISLALACWLLGLLAVLGFNKLAHVNWSMGDRTLGILDTMDFVASDIMLPLGALMVAIFVGWVMAPRLVRGQLSELGDNAFNVLRWLLRVVVPVLVLVVLLRTFL